MADNTCVLNTKIYNTFDNKAAGPTKSNAHDWAARLKLIEAGKEVLARGQASTEIDAKIIQDLRKKLNTALSDCSKLDESSGKFDRELEQRVALFQERHLSSQKDLAGSKEVDGVIGKNTLNKLKLVAEEKKAGVGAENRDSAPATFAKLKTETLKNGSEEPSDQRISDAEDRARMEERRSLRKKMAEETQK